MSNPVLLYGRAYSQVPDQTPKLVPFSYIYLNKIVQVSIRDDGFD